MAGRQFVLIGAPTTTGLLTLWGLLLGRPRPEADARPPRGRPHFAGRALHAPRRDRDLQPPVLAAGRRAPSDLVGWAPLDTVVRSGTSLVELASGSGIQRIIIAPGESLDGAAVVDVIGAAKATGLRVSLLPGMLATVGSSVVFDDLGGIVLLGVPRFGLSQSSALVKRTFDLVGALVLLIATSPLLVMAMLAIKLGSPGRIRQTRVGRGGGPFAMIKLRTMVDGADALKSELVGLTRPMTCSRSTTTRGSHARADGSGGPTSTSCRS